MQAHSVELGTRSGGSPTMLVPKSVFSALECYAAPPFGDVWVRGLDE